MAKKIIDTRAVTATLPNGDVWSFKPTGPLLTTGHNPDTVRLTAEKQPIFSVRMIIGFNIGTPQTLGYDRWSLNDVMQAVFELRRAQLSHDPEADVGVSFVPQEGVWQKTVGNVMYNEPGVQVFIINQDTSILEQEFFQDMDNLAHVLVVRLKQMGILMEQQVNGVSLGLFMVTLADPPEKKIGTNPKSGVTRTWLDEEEVQSDIGQFRRTFKALHQDTGKLVLGHADIPDTAFSVPAFTRKEHGYLKINEEKEWEFVPHTKQRPVKEWLRKYREDLE